MGYQYGLSALLYLSRAYWTGYLFCLLRHDQIWKSAALSERPQVRGAGQGRVETRWCVY